MDEQKGLREMRNYVSQLTSSLGACKTQLHETVDERDRLRAELERAEQESTENYLRAAALMKVATEELDETRAIITENAETMAAVIAERDTARTNLAQAQEVLGRELDAEHERVAAMHSTCAEYEARSKEERVRTAALRGGLEGIRDWGQERMMWLFGHGEGTPDGCAHKTTRDLMQKHARDTLKDAGCTDEETTR